MIHKTLKVVFLMGGLGSRLRPFSWSKPKQLIQLAGKTVLDHVIEGLNTIPNSIETEWIMTVGNQGEQIKNHIRSHYPTMKTQFVGQETPRGQSEAVMLAKKYLTGPVLIVFPDTIIETDLSIIEPEQAEGIVWAAQVNNPEEFGVVMADKDGFVKKLIEKPKNAHNNLAIVGFYYFKQVERLIGAIEKQIDRGVQRNGEFYLADAINIMLEDGLRLRTETVESWLDAGTPENLLTTNRILLNRNSDIDKNYALNEDVEIIEPVAIHPSAIIKNSIIGPYVSIGRECEITECILKNSIADNQANIRGIIAENCLIGQNATLIRRGRKINCGDDSVITQSKR